jgi:hypothetical protein
MKKYFLSFIILLMASTMAASKSMKLRTGDLIFQNIACGELCDAINEVTEGYEGTHFSHVGIVWIDGDTAKVIEAVSKGVSINTLKKFLERNGEIAIGRLKGHVTNLPKRAAAEALKYVGKPYDDYFDMSNGAYYCSELVYYAYKNANGGKEVFLLAPMTYLSPKTGKTFGVWADYFKQLGVPVPEGKLGINPGGLSRSALLKITLNPKL